MRGIRQNIAVKVPESVDEHMNGARWIDRMGKPCSSQQRRSQGLLRARLRDRLAVAVRPVDSVYEPVKVAVYRDGHSALGQEQLGHIGL